MATFEQKGRFKFKDAEGNLHKLAIEPNVHASTHSKGGTDPISAESIGAVSTLGTVTATDLLAWASEQTISGSFYVTINTNVNVPEIGYYVGFLDVASYERRIDMTAINGLRRWVNQTRAETFTGWVEQYNASNPPTAEDVGAVPKDRAIHINPGDTIPLDGVNILTLHAGVYRIAGHNLIGIPPEYSKYGSLSIFRYGGYNWGFALLVDSVNDREWIADGNWESSLVWREIRTNANPGYTYGTEDLTAGTSPLETGKLYFVYE